MNLGHLERVDLRNIWETEAQHFTPWLAQEDNLAILSEALNIELELEAQEQNVGPFRADLLCKNTEDSSWVLIENQMEITDHRHLGQLLTYASGLQAATIVWISAKFTDEHRAALDWLNNITEENFRFFGLEVELWKIGTSAAAPKFNIVSKPNDWSKTVSNGKKSIDNKSTSEIKQKQYSFWELLKNQFDNLRCGIRITKALPQHWINISIGKTGFKICPTLNTRESRLGVELYISCQNSKELFQQLYSQRDSIEREYGEALDWQELPDKKACRVLFTKTKVNPLLESLWPEYINWFELNIKKFYSCFYNRIKTLSASPQLEDDEPSQS
ncbi:DUF4268 domain-containing protein [Solidesulfovibrio magneticus]|uniref:DUF4268 domain-containing protein n=1 Tax=Solidesulfovibrio magneticus (strain ATCC 700980 / DSM 13731 / RS-1) TaxID=573370 RepID=C4XTH6_SOLM1|nr:DUF4268 domain-containing protein [Solidesulfovibrio magneticus]BAH75973.1 hypothetical protein DMR_24820 [Solidesulfovibrio magneticus RS-1]